MIGRVRAGIVKRREGYAVAIGAVAAVSVAIGLVLSVVSIANISILYLIAVLAIGTRYGRSAAVLASVAAFLTFNWFFVEPVHTLRVGRPEEVVALVVLLLTAVVTGQLAARERARVEEAQRREREATLLRGLVAALGEADLDLARGLRAAEATLAEALGLAAARITLAGQPAPGDEDAPPDGGPQFSRTLSAPGGERIGTLRTARGAGSAPFDGADEALLAAAATQLGGAIERARLRHEATEAETLRRTDELKSALLNAVSHDLRTPLASILASAGSLRQGDIDWTEEEQDEFAGAIVAEAERLNGIVGNLLDLSRIEGGSLRPDKGWHDLGALIGDVVRRVRPRYPQHHFAIDVAPDLPPLCIDWVEIDQVLSNLVENAAKYSPPATKVWIAARRDDRCVRVQVADRGPGIPGAAMAALFTPFYRIARKDGQAGPKGTGLGLAVARGLVEAHGGRIAAGNRDDGGAIFTFTLPLPAEEPAPPPGLADAAPVGGEARG